MIRKTIFWAHLVAGVTVGIVILIMSATGVLLAYEYQIIENADMKLFSSDSTDGRRIPLEQALAIAVEETGQSNASSVTVRNDLTAPYEVSLGRRGRAYIDAYTGEYLGSGAQGVRDFMSAVTGWHRWLNVEGEGRDTARAITGASNALFLFILISGIYLWLPAVWNKASLSMRILLKKNRGNSKVRDYNWHHVFGFWALIPLIALVATAIVFSYPSVRSALNDVTGGGEQQGPPVAPAPEVELALPAGGAGQLNLDALLDVTQRQAEGWYKITVTPARNEKAPAQMVITFANGHRPTTEQTWYLNPYNAEVLAQTGWHDLSTANKANQLVRRLHTGEFYGIVGQTIAGIASLLACIMVWTGLALAWRRLISPLFERRKSVAT